MRSTTWRKEEKAAVLKKYLEVLLVFIDTHNAYPSWENIQAMLGNIQNQIIPNSIARDFSVMKNVSNLLYREQPLIEELIENDLFLKRRQNFKAPKRFYHFVSKQMHDEIVNAELEAKAALEVPVANTETEKPEPLPSTVDSIEAIDEKPSSNDPLTVIIKSMIVDAVSSALKAPVAQPAIDIGSLATKINNIDKRLISIEGMLARMLQRIPSFVESTDRNESLCDEDLERLTSPDTPSTASGTDTVVKLHKVKAESKIPKVRILIYGLIPAQQQIIDHAFPDIQFTHIHMQRTSLIDSLNSVDFAIGMTKFMPHTVDANIKQRMKDKYTRCSGSLSSLKIVIRSLLTDNNQPSLINKEVK